MKNGNSVGITFCAHKAKPFCAANMLDLENVIRKIRNRVNMIVRMFFLSEIMMNLFVFMGFAPFLKIKSNPRGRRTWVVATQVLRPRGLLFLICMLGLVKL